MNILIAPTEAERETAAPLRGKTVQVLRIDLNDPGSVEPYECLGGFALHPDLGISAVDQNQEPVAHGELVFVVRRKG